MPFLILALISIACITMRKGHGIRWRRFIEAELIFTLAFFLFAFVRAFSPEIYFTGGEKLSEFGFINAILRSNRLPPYDPYFGGEPIQYYYMGHLIVANILKITGIAPEVGFNLATASFFALTAQITYGLGLSLTGRRRYGVITLLFVLILGNLTGIIQLLLQMHTSSSLLYFDYWHASRIIPGTINEFPYFSFLHGDVHPHMIAIPFKILLITLFFDLLSEQNRKIGAIAASGVFTGFLAPLNTWDYPVFLMLLLLIILIRGLKIREVVVGISAATLPYLPFFISTQGRGIGFVTERTDFINFFLIYGLFLLIIYAYILYRLDSRAKLDFIMGILILLPISWLIDFQLLFVLIPLIILPSWDVLKGSSREERFLSLLILSGALVALGCEVIYVDDAFTGSYERMNTVFKLYLDLWILWGVASALALSRISLRGMKTPSRHIFSLLLIALLISASVYPVFATSGRSHAFKVKPTLDGLFYARNDFKWDMDAIYWINENIKGHPVFLTIPARDYTWESRVASITGVPIVIGWMGEEIMWRGDRKEVTERMNDVMKVLSSPVIDEEVIKILERYNVSYIYIGPVERERYPQGVLKFEDWDGCEVVYRNEGVVIYYRENPCLRTPS
ncbi:MAG: conserved hypothetical protein, membrane [Candidatus Syntrophoarchaeum butanivorans]|uniref:YYY membrane protein n=1 Tax=Candidatus Syntropharchaeum butanivorans TaxID=1839936 RepID=A0A1F2P4S9_9EURY|nr:MAG: conserved hypothetical protein, membrane [Candidatus Syntrophoarchaeum butanivorans]